MTAETQILGLIAGGGRLPFLVADGAKKAGLKVICVGLAANVEAGLAEKVDEFYVSGVARPCSWIRNLKRHGVSKTVMVGRVAKEGMFTPFKILHYLPDWRALRAWYWTLRNKDKRNNTILRVLADELAKEGIILEDSTMYCKEHTATQGAMTKHTLNLAVEADIEFGWPLVKKLGELDIGQAIAVKEREVIAVEAIEGTARMIERAGKYCKKGGWMLIKAAKPSQDMRIDVPCVGPDAMRSMADNGAE